MNTQTLVKIGASRQVVIPKHIYDELDLEPGDYLGVEKEDKKIVFEPQTLMSRELAAGIAESIKDFKEGRSHGPFNTAEDAIAHLHAYVKKSRATHKQTKQK